jgi:hypothetical protein
MATKKTKDSVDDELTDDTGDVENSDTIDDVLGDDIEFIKDVPKDIADPEKWKKAQEDKLRRLFVKRGELLKEKQIRLSEMEKRLALFEGSVQSELRQEIEALQSQLNEIKTREREATLKAHTIERLISAGLTPEDAIFISGVDEETIDAQIDRLAERTRPVAQDDEEVPPASVKRKKYIGNPADIHGLTRKKLEQMSQADVMELMNNDPDALARALRNG